MVGGALVFIRGSGFFFTGREVLGSCVQEGRDVMSDGKGIIAPKCLRCFAPGPQVWLCSRARTSGKEDAREQICLM